MIAYVICLVALVAVVLAYDVARRALNARTQKQLDEVRASRDELSKRLDEHITLFNDICRQWRAKVGELEQRLERPIADAKNELAGILAQATDTTQKGWR